jgi:hypothetical protein
MSGNCRIAHSAARTPGRAIGLTDLMVSENSTALSGRGGVGLLAGVGATAMDWVLGRDVDLA